MSTQQPDVHALAGAYVCDALDVPERVMFERHLAECVDCETEVADLREAAAYLGMAVGEQPHADLKALIAARVHEADRRLVEASRTRVSRSAGSRRGHNRRAWSGWLVAAVLAAIVGGLGARAVDQHHRAATLAAQSAALAQLIGAPDATTIRASVASGGQAVVVDSRSLDEAVVLLTGLGAPPPGKAYQLWLMGPARDARSIGLLGDAADERPAAVLAHGSDAASAFGMSIEPAGGSPRPTSAPVLLVALHT